MTVKRKVKFEGVPFEGNIEELIIQALIEKQGVDIQCLNLKKINHTYFDYFVICTGNSVTHIRALCEAVEHELETTYGLRPHHIEGYSAANWILMDYGFLVVHIFHKETRQFYALSRLWNDPGRDKEE